VLSLAGGGAALASCWDAGFGFTAAVCCGSLLGASFFGVSFLADSFLRGSLGFGFAAATVSVCSADFAFGVAVDPVVAESAPRACVVESVAATCVCAAGFDPKKPPNNLLANEPLLLAVDTGAGCGGSDPVGGTLAGGMLPPTWARKTLFMPPSSPLRIGATGKLDLTSAA
jgi:hypothetical protein